MNKKQKDNNPNLEPLSPRRIRQVRPDFFKNETVADLSMAARLGFIGIWILCERFGHFEWRPRTLKSDIFPHDNLDFDAILAELVEFGFVRKYSACPVGSTQEKDYGQVENWDKYQYIGLAEMKMESAYPKPKTFSNVLISSEAETF